VNRDAAADRRAQFEERAGILQYDAGLTRADAETRARAEIYDAVVAVLRAHPSAEIFPLMVGFDFDALIADIRDNGQREPIIVHDGLILDGRNRYRACRELGIEPVIATWGGQGTPESFVISMNLRRRHLNESQRAMIAKKLANMTAGRPKKENPANLPSFSQEAAAALLNVSSRIVRQAAVVLEKAAPELLHAVERGDIPVSTAAQLVDLPKDRQREIAKGGKKAAAKSAKQISALKHANRAAMATRPPKRPNTIATFASCGRLGPRHANRPAPPS
jgi:hypothetical protein